MTDKSKSEQEEWTIEGIIDHDWDSDGILNFKVRWDGWGSEYDEFLTIDKLDKCEDALKTYENSLSQKKKRELNKYRNGKKTKKVNKLKKTKKNKSNNKQSKTKKIDKKKKEKQNKLNNNNNNDGKIDENKNKKNEKIRFDENGNEIYFPEKILKHKKRKKNGKIYYEYYIKWFYYDNPDDITWEHENNIKVGANDMIKKYWIEYNKNNNDNNNNNKVSKISKNKRIKKRASRKSFIEILNKNNLNNNNNNNENNNDTNNINEPPNKKRKLNDNKIEWETIDGKKFKEHCLKIKKKFPKKFKEFFKTFQN